LRWRRAWSRPGRRRLVVGKATVDAGSATRGERPWLRPTPVCRPPPGRREGHRRLRRQLRRGGRAGLYPRPRGPAHARAGQRGAPRARAGRARDARLRVDACVFVSCARGAEDRWACWQARRPPRQRGAAAVHGAHAAGAAGRSAPAVRGRGGACAGGRWAAGRGRGARAGPSGP